MLIGTETKRLKLAFMYNHETVHQVAHTAPILKELVSRHPEQSIDVLTSTEGQETLVRKCLGLALSQRTNFIKLRHESDDGKFMTFASKLSPLKRLDTLKKNLNLFERYDVLVVPEWTSLMLKTRYGLTDLKFIFTHHGAGDRSVTYNENIADFDFVLLPGRKFEREHLRRDLVREGRYAIIGYPKFDFKAETLTPSDKLFNNDKPIVLYNPHFDPHLSSWYDMGRQVLDFFAASKEYNIIFAPHVMLFERKFHTSFKHKLVRRCKDITAQYRNYDNIIIDTGSLKSVDMTYSRAADIYLGDVSSQVYEFLHNKGPCVFLNAHDADWKGNNYYAHWQLGPVIDDVEKLGSGLKESIENYTLYEGLQKAAFSKTFDLTSKTSSIRAADAIESYLHSLMKVGADLEAAQ